MRGGLLGRGGFPLGKTVLDPEEDHRVEMRWLGEPRDSVSWDMSQGFGTGTPQMVGPLPLRESLLLSVFGAPGQQVKEDTLHGFCLVSGYDLLATWRQAM